MTGGKLLFSAMFFGMISIGFLTPASAHASEPTTTNSLDQEIEFLKKKLLALNSEFTILEEELLFPAHSQISIFLSIQEDVNFPLSTLTIEINDKPVSHASYTASEIDALTKGGIQRLYIGNISQGSNKISAEIFSAGNTAKSSRIATTFKLTKQQKPTLIELRIVNSGTREKPHFDLEQWLL
jgi:hypothetical protein